MVLIVKDERVDLESGNLCEFNLAGTGLFRRSLNYVCGQVWPPGLGWAGCAPVNK